MALLLAPVSGPAAEWKRLLAAELPNLDVRYYPETGDLKDIDVAAVARVPPGFLASLPRLKLIISLFAGPEALLADKSLPQVPIVRAGNPEGDALMNDTALLHVLRHHRFVPDYQSQQQRREWKRLPVLRPAERKVGVMGLGQIGLATAQFLQRYGFAVSGWSRRPKDVPGIAVFHGRAGFGDFLAQSEILVDLLPTTPETIDLIDRSVFARMPKGAAFINLARGHHVVERDLIAALDEGQLSAATLDVFREEPLAKESPLWAHPRITIIPHASRRHDPVDIVPNIAANLRRLERGEPLLQLVDRAAGY